MTDNNKDLKRTSSPGGLGEDELGRFKLLCDSLADLVYICDAEANILYVNQAFENFTGQKPQEFLGKPFSPLFDEDNLKKAVDVYQRTLNGESPNYELYFKDTGILCEYRNMPLRDSSGSVVGVIGTARDITERWKMEEALLKEKNFTEGLIESLPGVLYFFDAEGKFVKWNKNLEDITGYSAEEIERMGPLNLIAEGERAYVSERIKEVFTQGRSAAEAHLLSKDGKKTPYYFTGVRVTLDGKRCLVGVGLDITERNLMEAEALKAQKLESLGVLAGGIAHDFNNLLTSILGNVSFAKHAVELRSTAFERLIEAEKACVWAKELTRQLLTFSKGGEPVKKTVVIDGLLKESAVFALRGSKVRCDFDISEGLWPVDIDDGQIGQVINNLVINADQAMPEGGVIEVRASNVEAGPEDRLALRPGRHVEITIEDHGTGIPEEFLQKIFDPYFTTKQKGSGLGLATVYSIIKNHGGHISVESTIGAGTAFHIHLPASDKTPEPKKADEETLVRGSGRVLVMDDEEIIRDLAGDTLTHLGYTVALARDGEEAVEMYRKSAEAGAPFDIVIMDLTVPGGMGGKEAIKKLLSLYPDAKAIVSSGYSTDRIMSDFTAHGFKGVIEKPYKMAALSELLRKLIKGR